jgi:hypothetical protein
VPTTLLPSEPIIWDQAKLDSLTSLYKKWIWAIDFYFSQVKEGYIVEFDIEYSDSFSEVERKFEQCPRNGC